MTITAEQLPMKVSQCARALGVSVSTMGRMIKAGCVRVSNEKPRKVVEVLFPGTLTAANWRRELAKHTTSLRPGTYGFTEDGRLDVLIGTEVVSIPCGETVMAFHEAKARIEQLAAQR